MASRYWVLAISGSWNGDNTGKWAATSGGLAGEAEPTRFDDVFFDANSGTNTVTITTVEGRCQSLNTTGYTGTLAFGSRGLFVGSESSLGNFTLGSGMAGGTIAGGQTITFISTTAGTNNITLNGITLQQNITFNGVGGAWTLQDALTQTTNAPGITVTNGTFNTNGKTVTALDLAIPGGGSPVLTLGASTVNLTGDSSTGTVLSFGASITFNTNTSTIVFTNTTANAKLFDGGGYTFNNFNITGGGAGIVTISGSNTFANLPQIVGGTKNLRFTAGTTQTYTGGTDFGNGANLITIDTQTGGSAATLSKASGTVQVTSISLKDSTAAGGAVWKAPSNNGNIDVSGNTGWVFTPVGGGGAGVQQNMLLLGVG